ncbi:MAG: hypothetical protein NT015_02260 [Alphaproteobacteria bacterium]|nr:hypothetical protein [Alphaproteobacteria bacterium]
MAGQNFFRIAVVALGLSTLSFAAGIAGDLTEPPRSGQRVVLRIPPEIPADAPRARPILSTASAEAAPMRSVHRARRAALVEAVQLAHEESFDLAPVAFEIAATASPKPLVEPRVKSRDEALPEPYATKVA